MIGTLTIDEDTVADPEGQPYSCQHGGSARRTLRVEAVASWFGPTRIVEGGFRALFVSIEQKEAHDPRLCESTSCKSLLG